MYCIGKTYHAVDGCDEIVMKLTFTTAHVKCNNITLNYNAVIHTFFIYNSIQKNHTKYTIHNMQSIQLVCLNKYLVSSFAFTIHIHCLLNIIIT